MTNSFATVAALIVKLPKGNPIRVAYAQAAQRQAEFSRRGRLAAKTRTKATKSRKATRH